MRWRTNAVAQEDGATSLAIPLVPQYGQGHELATDRRPVHPDVGAELGQAVAAAPPRIHQTDGAPGLSEGLGQSSLAKLPRPPVWAGSRARYSLRSRPPRCRRRACPPPSARQSPGARRWAGSPLAGPSRCSGTLRTSTRHTGFWASRKVLAIVLDSSNCA